MDDYIKLKITCFHRGYERYGEEFGDIKRYLDRELMQISKIPGGAKALLEAAEFMKKISKYYGNYGRKLRYGFRGGITSSLVAYLCDITDAKSEGAYSWTYYLNRERISIDVNMTANTYSHIVGYYNIRIPACIRLHSCADLTLLEMLQEPLKEYTEQESRGILEQFWENCFVKNSSRVEYLYYLREESIPEIGEIMNYLWERGQLPQTGEQLTRLISFVTAEFWDKELSHVSILQDAPHLLYETPVFSPEDIYDGLVQEGCPAEKTITIAKRVQSWNGKLKLDDMIEITNYYGENYMRVAEQIGHLYCRCQCKEMSGRILQMMDLINRDFEKYRGIYDYLLGH